METTLLDCIKRVPEQMERALENRQTTFADLHRRFGADLPALTELIFVGSGTSYTAAVTARLPAQTASGLRVTACTPADFLDSLSCWPQGAFYVFVSQTGTSTLSRQALLAARERGLKTAALSENAGTPISALADVWIDMGCGAEEYLMRTIGYSLSVLTLTLLGMEIGRTGDRLCATDEARWLQEARGAAQSIPERIREAGAWLDANRRKMLRSDCIVFTGAGALQGVALEGAVKTWEAPRITALGVELEEGMHGPNFGYDHRHCLIVLNGGGPLEDKALALCRYMKGEMDNGFLIGQHPIDGQDLGFAPQGGHFACLEFAAVLQVLAYRLATDQGWNLMIRDDHARMYRYFNSHDPAKP